ncbi:uncharacterized protein LOC124449246 [Xenia sp. Carnegie-2017]|uniref:uncharacterized protein LOC124449246 n=1 Tax=Xenia sp. Carnegie-2017 TaxID=2897299 RepID=UPI001F03B2F1|nr:uncharacterized protein LOC124449246 [Xenia sp. Carnegie-2017]
MSNSSRSSSLSESSIETNASISSSEFMTANSDESNSKILPFADNIQPLASPDEIAEYEAAVAEERRVEDMLQDRFDARVDVTSCVQSNILLDVVPTASAEEIEPALSNAGGDVDAAAQQLLRSPQIKDKDIATHALPIVPEDIADLELREMITELENCHTPSPEMLNKLCPYLFESGVDMDILSGNTQLAIQDLMFYQVIDKRRRELDDIAKGMEDAGLHSFIGHLPTNMLEIFTKPFSRSIYISWQNMKKVNHH